MGKEQKEEMQKSDNEKNNEKNDEKSDGKDNQNNNQNNNEDIVSEPIVKKKGKAAKIIVATAAAFIVLIAGVYGGITWYYMNHFFPNTTINEVICDNLDTAEVTMLLEGTLEDYLLEVSGRDLKTEEAGTILGVISADDVEMAYVDTAILVQELLESQNPLLWVNMVRGFSYNYILEQAVEFDRELLADKIVTWEACQKKNMRKPENAYISNYSEEKKCYEIVPETAGTELMIDKVLEKIEGALLMREAGIDLEEQECYTEAAVLSNDKRLTEVVDTVNRWLSTEIVYDWNGNEVVLDADTLVDWITVEPDGPALDEEAVAGFVAARSKEYDTYGKRRNFITKLGIELKLRSGYYGWKTDRAGETAELIQLIYQGEKTEKEPAYTSRAMAKGINDIGDSYVEADLTHQHLYLFIEGEIVLETDFVSGNMSIARNVTPEGVFGLAYKTRNAVLRGEDYETPVKYWMPFYGNYGMHDASWRRTFGGDIYLTSGSHGCLNLPTSAASKIYEYVSTGFPVICYYYEEDPLEAVVTQPEGNSTEGSQPEGNAAGESRPEENAAGESQSEENAVEGSQPEGNSTEGSQPEGNGAEGIPSVESPEQEHQPEGVS